MKVVVQQNYEDIGKRTCRKAADRIRRSRLSARRDVRQDDQRELGRGRERRQAHVHQLPAEELASTA